MLRIYRKTKTNGKQNKFMKQHLQLEAMRLSTAICLKIIDYCRLRLEEEIRMVLDNNCPYFSIITYTLGAH